MRENKISLSGNNQCRRQPRGSCFMTGKEFLRFPFPKKFNLFENQGLLFSAKWSIMDLGKQFA